MLIKKKLLVLMFFLLSIILISCENPGESLEEPACEAPFILVGEACQLEPLDASTVLPYLIGSSSSQEMSSIPYDDFLKNAVMYEVNIRQYSTEGTLSKVTEDLDRLADLGVDILWLMPIHPISEMNRKGSLGSYYAISDYQAINPEFGTMKDFETFLEEAHKRDMKVILDLVINHTGWDHPWLTASPEFYTHVNGTIIHPSGTDWTDVADLNHENEDLKQELVDMTAFWVERGVDGFRADVAGSVPNHVWEAIYDTISELNEDVFMLAEDNSRFDWFNIFNANYGGWDLLHQMHQIASGNHNDQLIIDYLNRTHDRYLENTFPLLFTTNHDVNSWEGTHEDRLGSFYPSMQLLTFTLPGMPLLYSGQESSIETSLAFFEKDLITWNDYDQTTLLQNLIALKDENDALSNYNVHQSMWILEDENPSVLSFIRTDITHSNHVLILSNLSDKTQEINLHMHAFRDSWLDITDSLFNADDLTQLSSEIYLSQQTTMTLKPYEIKILILNK